MKAILILILISCLSYGREWIGGNFDKKKLTLTNISGCKLWDFTVTTLPKNYNKLGKVERYLASEKGFSTQRYYDNGVKKDAPTLYPGKSIEVPYNTLRKQNGRRFIKKYYPYQGSFYIYFYPAKSCGAKEADIGIQLSVIVEDL